MKVMITSAGGQLGRALVEAFTPEIGGSGDLIAIEHRDLDISDEQAVAAAVDAHRPDVVINAAAWTDVDGCEADPQRAHRINALGPWWLARACERHRAHLLTISTDYVFSGDAPLGADGERRAWTEFDATAPINEYGRSKVAGEQLVRQTLAEHNIVRTSWLVGPTGRNFLTTVLRLAEERGRVSIVDDQFGSPTFTCDLAPAVLELAYSNHFGTWNRTNSGWCSWFEFAAALFDYARKTVELLPQSSSALRRPAARPKWSVLDPNHSESVGLCRIPHAFETLEQVWR